MPMIMVIIGIVILALILCIGCYKKTISTCAKLVEHQSFTKEQQEQIQKIFLEIIRKKPDLFVNAVNEGMKLQQDQVRIDLQKRSTLRINEIKKAGIPLGNLKGSLQLIAFIDLACPHCQNFIKVALKATQKNTDILLYLIPITILGESSAFSAQAMIAASKQGVKKFEKFIVKLSNDFAKFNKNNLPNFIKSVGFNKNSFDKVFKSEDTINTIIENTAIAEELKIPGVPMVLGLQGNGDLAVIPSLDLDKIDQLSENLKNSSFSTTCVSTNPVRENKDES